VRAHCYRPARPPAFGAHTPPPPPRPPPPPPAAPRPAGAGGPPPAALTHRPKDQKIADRLRHANPGGEGVRIFPARGMLDAFLPRLDHRRAALRLDHHHARPL